MTNTGIAGKIAQVGVGFGTGRHSSNRSAIKIRNRAEREEEKIHGKRRAFVFKKNRADFNMQTDDPPCHADVEPKPFF